MTVVCIGHLLAVNLMWILIDVIYVKDGKLGEVKRRKDGTEWQTAETALYSK
jgi:hypothetical protein